MQTAVCSTWPNSYWLAWCISTYHGPASIQAEAALCDEAWQQALNAQSVQLRAVRAIEAHDHVATVENTPASWTMDNITQGIVSFQGTF